MKTLFVHLLPSLFEPEQLAGCTAVVIDILRATTTITHALANGASQIFPCLTIQEAFSIQQTMAANVLLGGERGGVKIEGFDLSNSPHDYTRNTVSGQTIVFTTTNGTQALHRSLQASQMLMGCFGNLNRIVDICRLSTQDIHLVCAGTNGEVSNEDVLFAGAVSAALSHDCSSGNDATTLARCFWETATSTGVDGVYRAIKNSYGGRNLQKLGFHQDLRTAAQIDTLSAVGRFDGKCICLHDSHGLSFA